MIWYSKTAAESIRELGSDPKEGITETEAQKRLEQYGPNQLEEKQKKSLFKQFLDQMKDPMILVLLAAAVLSLVASGGKDYIDAIIIVLIVLLNAVISIFQENNAEKSLEALRKMSAPLAKVVRGGKMQPLDTSLLVPGDLIALEAGDLVPADARLLEAVNLRVDESAITGESIPSEKDAQPTFAEDTPLGDRQNMVISSTVITNGRAVALVTETGMNTQVGKIAGLLIQEENAETPLQKKMAEISRSLSFICLAVVVVMFGLGLLQNRGLVEMFMMAVSLAVAAIPEGLPAIVTIVLAMGVKKMARQKAIVKKLSAVETLGCASVICSDKTGTLTQNRMTVVKVWTADPANRPLALTIGALCNDTLLTTDEQGSPVLQGDPTETALVAIAYKEGLDKNKLQQEMPRVAELPFDSQRKLMSTIHPRAEGGFRVLVKGAPDLLLERSATILNGQAGAGAGQLSAQAVQANQQMADQALRVLGVAYRDMEQIPQPLTPETLEQGLTFVGLMGMIDPPREEVKTAVAQCYAAGIRPVMITGDHQATAVAIARELGIFRDGNLATTGQELQAMSQQQLEDQVTRYAVYARVSPEDKMRIIRAWQKNGQVVAMTGDGVNDAPALKAADIGCAMGITGTDVAKGAADMVLTDDNFTTIVGAVEQGRGIYANIKKSIHYLLSCNIGEIVTIFTATLFNFHQMPLVPVQILWLNLVTDSLPALALGLEDVEEGAMQQRPRDARESLFAHGFAWRLVWQGAMIGLLTLLAYYLGEYVLGSPQTADAVANTMAFATLTFCQLFHAFDVRSERLSIFSLGITSNKAMNKAFTAGLLMQLTVLLVPPVQKIFSVVSMDAVQWGIVLGLSLVPVAVCELVKLIAGLRRGRPRAV